MSMRQLEVLTLSSSDFRLLGLEVWSDWFRDLRAESAFRVLMPLGSAERLTMLM